MKSSRHGVCFAVWLRVSYNLSIADLAQEVSFALGTILRPDTAPGPWGGYIGELAGLSLSLDDPDYDNHGPPQQVALVGAPDTGAAAAPEHNLDISPYIAELLSLRTERPWRASSREGDVG